MGIILKYNSNAFVKPPDKIKRINTVIAPRKQVNKVFYFAYMLQLSEISDKRGRNIFLARTLVQNVTSSVEMRPSVYEN